MLQPVLKILGGAALGFVLITGSTSPGAAKTIEDRMKLLEATIHDLLERDSKKSETIKKLNKRIEELNRGERRLEAPKEASHAGHHHGHDHGSGKGRKPDLYSVSAGDKGRLRLKGVSLDTNIVGGYSSERDDAEIRRLHGGGHDPDRTGFTVQAVDLGIYGALDPYFDAQANIVFLLNEEGETKVELEEAFMRTKNLPLGLEFEAGMMFTEIGAFNPMHIHGWRWIDQPIIMSRVFGGDGMRAPGLRAAWKAPWNGTFHITGQNPIGETMVSFLANDEFFGESPIGGRALKENAIDGIGELVWTGRYTQHIESGKFHVDLGLSGAIGPNATGRNANTYIWGADFTANRKLSNDRSLFVYLEWLHRIYEAAADPASGFAEDTLDDYGMVAELLYGFNKKWSAGARYEYVHGSGESVGNFASREADPNRDTRHRFSPLLAWQFAPGAKLRLQYNYDQTNRLAKNDAHSVWLGFNWSIGAGNTGH